jgi:steroid delta-isomerase-like uncharacterized protein
MTREDVLALLDRRHHAIAARDVTVFSDLYADDARLQSPLAGEAVGPNAIATATAVFFTAFPDSVINEEPPILDADGTRACIVAEAVGKHTGMVLGLPPTGRSFRFALTFVLDLADGKITRERRIYDFTGLLLQLGVLKAKPA